MTGNLKRMESVASRLHESKARKRKEESDCHIPAGFLMIEKHRADHRKTRPEVIHHADLKRLAAALRKLQREREAERADNRKREPEEEILLRVPGQMRNPENEQRKEHSDHVADRETLSHSKDFLKRPDESDRHTPANRCEKPNEGRPIFFLQHKKNVQQRRNSGTDFYA